MLRLLFLIPLILFAAPWVSRREPIDPFISGDTFRAHCDFSYDEISKSLQPETVPPKSTIFVNGEMLGEFLEYLHPKIKNPYILVVHNSDRAIPGPYRSYLDDPKILALFTQNPDETVHRKLRPLPIGIENRHWNSHNWETLQEIKSKMVNKKYLLYCNFNRHTFPSERSEVLDQFSRKPFTYTATRKPYVEFVHDLATAKFVLSPRGNGLDCFRTWEALYAGSYPVVRTSPLDPLFEGLPVVIVQDWNEVNEPFLQKKFEEFSQRTDYQWEKIYIDYYLNQINAVKQLPDGAEHPVKEEILKEVLRSGYENGVLSAETPYHQGLKENVAKFYTSDGKLFATEEFSVDKKHSIATQYYPDGSVYRKTNYVNGLREGEEKTYHQTGSLCDVCFYSQDKLNGLYQSWNLEGILILEAEYREGLRHGKFNKYYQNGKPYLELKFAYDKLDGEKRKYDTNGNLTVSYYENGKLVQ